MSIPDARITRQPLIRVVLPLAVVLGCCLLSGVRASACSVPVFRYALERWPPDRYEVVVFLPATPSAVDRARVEHLARLATDDDRRANISVVAVDPTQDLDETMRGLWEAQDDPALPWMVVRYPRSRPDRESAWAGPLTDANLAALLDSPIRGEMLKRFADGQSAVWAFVESGDKAKDDAAVATLDTELKKMQQELELPELAEEDTRYLTPGEEGERPELKVSFSVVRVSRTDPAERIFLAMLLHSEPDLAELDEPMVFPVFGRGRALFALVGAGINASNIEEACLFLVGPCSCQVKDLNPGTDVVMAVNWDELVRGEWVRDAPLPRLPGLPFTDAGDESTGAAPASAPTSITSRPIAVPSRASAGVQASSRNVLLVALLGLVGLAAATVILKLKLKCS